MDASALYALAPEDFTAARDAAAKRARAAGDKAGAAALKALRRPSVSAWLVNRLVADHHELLEQLLAVGPSLAEAQATGRADALRELGRQRRALVEAVTDTALQARPSSAAVRDEVAGTLEAALADPSSADAVRSGRLVRALSYAGFGSVDLEGAVALSAATAATAGDGAEPRPGAGRAEQLRGTEAAAHDAAGRLDDAVRAAEIADRARVDADAGLAGAQQVVSHARAALLAAEQDLADRQEQQAAALELHERSVDAVRTAQAAEGVARAELDRLRRRPA